MGEKGDVFMAHLEAQMPLGMEPLELPVKGKRVGLVIVDEVNGFCTVGHGNLGLLAHYAATSGIFLLKKKGILVTLEERQPQIMRYNQGLLGHNVKAPTETVEAITKMVAHTDSLAKQFSARDWPIIAFLDTHDKDKPEHPYPPHCIVGTGEEDLVPELLWLNSDPNTTLMRKDCINGFVGGMKVDGSNIVTDWVQENRVQQILVVGICTDICVMDFVVTALSARNHGILKPLEDVYVYSEGCATYDMPIETAKEINVFPHPQDITHYMGLYFAKSRGAHIVNKVTLSQPTTP